MTSLRAAAAPTVLSLSVRLERGGPVVTEEVVTEQDLDEVVSEAWMLGHLRAGRLGSDPSALRPRVLPSTARHSGASAYTVETTDGDGRTATSSFSIRSLEHVAARAADRLAAAGAMEEGSVYYYDLLPVRPRPVRTEVAPVGCSTSSRSCDLSSVDRCDYSRCSIGPRRWASVTATPFRSSSPRTLGEGPSSARGEAAIARRPRSRVASSWVRCARVPLRGEFFVVVCEVLEALDAERAKYSLAYSGRTWTRIQTIVAAIQQRPATKDFRIVGQCHGHNFLPADGAPPCEACAGLTVCGRTSVFVSPDDLTWSRAVFARQPWKLCQIFGWNARREQVEGLFGLRDGRLLERGYYVLPDFDETRRD